MKKVSFFLVALAAICCAANLPPATFDAGGTVFDLEKISASRHPVKSAANYAKTVRLKESDPVVPAKLSADLPRGVVRYAFRYRLRLAKRPPPAGDLRLMVHFRGEKRADGTYAEGQPDWWIRVRDTAGGWRDYSRIIGGMQATTLSTELEFAFADSLGEFEIKDFTVTTAASDDHLLQTRLSPMGFFDGTFAIGSGQIINMVYRWRTRGHRPPLDRTKLQVRLELPPGIASPAASAAEKGTFRSERRADGRSVVTFQPRRELLPAFAYSGYQEIGILLESSLPPGAAAGEGVFTVLYDGKEAATPIRVKFLSVAPVKAEVVPRRYWNGIQEYKHNVFVEDEAVSERYAQFLADAGVREGMSGNPVMRRVMKKNGARCFIGGQSWIANGYSIGTFPPTMNKRPAEQRFHAFDPDYRTNLIAAAACPIGVYREESYFIEYVVPYLREVMKTCTGYMSNWEPDAFFGKGCACRRCGQAFAEFLKVPEAEVMKDWPDCAKPGGRLSKEATRFRAREHGRLVKTLNKWVKTFSGRDKSDGFIPEIVWGEVADARPYNLMQGEVSPREYARDLTWLNAWGPYVWWDASCAYWYEKRLPVAHFAAAKNVREHVDRVYGRGHPKLISFPSGMQGQTWVATPEWIGMAMDSFFFNGWEATSLYYFPKGYDARYWHAFAEATARAGRCERYVLDGTRTDALCEVTPVDAYAAPCRQVTAFLPSSTNMSPLQVASYDLNGGRVVAALNFWEKGAAFFTLKAKGLAPGSYTVVADGKTLWTPGGGRQTWTAAELEKGIFLGVGAARTVAFEICPAAENRHRLVQDEFTAEAARAAYERLRPALEKEAAIDKARERETGYILEDFLPEI